MKYNISKSVKYLMGLCVAGLFACGIYISLAYANVCFLPSGICDYGEETVEHQTVAIISEQCNGNLEQDKSKCCLLSPLAHFKCEQCENGRYKCDEECINEDYKLVTDRGTHQSECVCKGDLCGSLPTMGGKDLRDTHCSVTINSCGLCPENKCVCNGKKCSDDNVDYKKFECSRSLNNCGNCPTDKGATCECVNCCDVVFGNDWYSDTDRKCKFTNYTRNQTACYKPYDCTCSEEFSGSQKGDVCPQSNQVAEHVGTAENGDECYICRTRTRSESCAEHSDQHTIYHDVYSDPNVRNMQCQDYETVPFDDVTCYRYTERRCEDIFAGYSGAVLFLDSKTFSNSYSDCYNFDKKDDCKNYVGTCHLGKKKTCADRSLYDTQPPGKICDVISACDMTCFNPVTCRTVGPGCIENGGQFEANRDSLPCERICQYTEVFPADEGKTCYLCEAGCDPCKKINSAYRASNHDPCENNTCCQNGGWREVAKANAKHSEYYPQGREGCYTCTACNKINANWTVGEPQNCETQAKPVTEEGGLNNCYTCPTCQQYGASLTPPADPAYQNSKNCNNGKVAWEVAFSDDKKCYQCKTCEQINTEYHKSCGEGLTAVSIKNCPSGQDYCSQCFVCDSCPTGSSTTKPPHWDDKLCHVETRPSGLKCYSCNTCEDFGQQSSPTCQDTCKVATLTEEGHPGVPCYKCEQTKSCEQIWENDETYNSHHGYAIYDENKTGVGNLTCEKINKCDKDCWACRENQEVTCKDHWLNRFTPTPGFDVYNTPQTCQICATLIDPVIDKTCYLCKKCPETLPLPDPADETKTVNWKLMANCNGSGTSEECNGELHTQAKGYGGCRYSLCENYGCLDGYVDDPEECSPQQAYDPEPGMTTITGSGFCQKCGDCPPPYKNAVIGGTQITSYDCPADHQPLVEYIDGLKCYTCKCTDCSCFGLYNDDKSCPDDKPYAEIADMPNLGKYCYDCSDCPQTLPLEGDMIDEGKQCCETCQSLDKEVRCRTGEGKIINKTEICENSCVAHGYLESCPSGTREVSKYDKEIKKWCITDCKTPTPSSGGGGGGTSDSYCDAACAECCLKTSEGRIGYRSGAPGRCDSVCTEDRCCYHTPGNEHSSENDLICSVDSTINSGTCNPMDVLNNNENYFHCPNGSTCVWDGGSAPSTQGHCVGPGAENYSAYQPDDPSNPCTNAGLDCSSSLNGRICCVRGDKKYCVKTMGECKEKAIVEVDNPCDVSGYIEDENGDISTGNRKPCQDGATCENLRLICQCFREIENYGNAYLPESCKAFRNFFETASDFDEYDTKCSICLL